MSSSNFYGTIKNYKIYQTLGRGGFSKTRLIINEDGKQLAIKYTKKQKEKSINIKNLLLLVNEAKINIKLEHQHIAKIYEFQSQGLIYPEKYKNKKKKEFPVLYSILEYIPNGEMFYYVQKERFSEEIARYYFSQLISAIDYMHQKEYVHRDIKLDNILLDQNYDLKLIDYGFAAPIYGKDNSGFLTTKLGTNQYLPPEMHTEDKYEGSQADIFSSGVTLLIMVCGDFCFSQTKSADKAFIHIQQNNWKKFWEIVNSKFKGLNLSDRIKELIEKMICFNPADRISIKKILKDPWMKDIIPKPEQIIKEFKKRHYSLQKGNLELPLHNLKINNKEDVVQKGHYSDMALEEIIEMEQREVRQFIEIPGRFTAKAYDLKPDLILSHVVSYVYERSGNWKAHPKFMKIVFDLISVNGEKIIFSAEAMKGEKWNYLVLEKKEGDKFSFLQIFDEITEIIK